MWPTLLNMSRDDCRRTLRRLELETYSNVISVFRAQGELEDTRRKILEDIRKALHISDDRHSAEARRASNDELLATIAERLSGPNTGLGWIKEGRRKVPLMPRTIPQTAHAELADETAREAVQENRELAAKEALEAAIQEQAEENGEADMELDATCNNVIEADDGRAADFEYPRLVTEDQTLQYLEAEAHARKRTHPESGALPQDAASTEPKRSCHNTLLPPNHQQKHLNISQIYSSYTKPVPEKPATSTKQSHSREKPPPKTPTHAQRSETTKQKSQKQTRGPNKNSRQIVISKSQLKHTLEAALPAFHPQTASEQQGAKMQPSGFQATFAQSIKKGIRNINEYGHSMQTQALEQSPCRDSTTLQLLKGNLPPDLAAPMEESIPHTPRMLIKKRPQFTQPSPIIQNPQSNIGMHTIQSTGESFRPQIQPISIASSSLQKNASFSGKTIGKFPSANSIAVSNLSNASHLQSVSDKSSVSHKLPKQKNIIITSAGISSSISRETISTSDTQSFIKLGDDNSELSAPMSDLKPEMKPLVINAKAQKMVVLPAKARGKTSILGGNMPLLQVKGLPTVKILPASSAVGIKAAANTTLINKQASISSPTIISSPRIVNMDQFKVSTSETAIAESPKFIQGLTVGPKAGHTLIRPAGVKGNVIVVPKGTTLGKGTFTFSKNGNEFTKFIMSNKNLTQMSIPVAIKSESISAQQPVVDAAKTANNVILVDMKSDRVAHSSVSELMNVSTADDKSPSEAGKRQAITENTPVLFANELNDDAFNTSSMDSVSEHTDDAPSSLDQQNQSEKIKLVQEDVKNVKDNKEVNSCSWSMGLGESFVQEKDSSKMDNLQLDMGMSSDSETDGYLVKADKTCSTKQSQQLSIESTHDAFSCSSLSLPNRMLLSQLQDEGSSSNDSPFALGKNMAKANACANVRANGDLMEVSLPSESEKQELESKRKEHSDRAESIKTTSAKQKLDIFSGSAGEMHLETMEYLPETIMSGEDVFPSGARPERTLEMQLSQLLGENINPEPNITLTK